MSHISLFPPLDVTGKFSLPDRLSRKPRADCVVVTPPPPRVVVGVLVEATRGQTVAVYFYSAECANLITCSTKSIFRRPRMALSPPGFIFSAPPLPTTTTTTHLLPCGSRRVPLTRKESKQWVGSQVDWVKRKVGERRVTRKPRCHDSHDPQLGVGTGLDDAVWATP